MPCEDTVCPYKIHNGLVLDKICNINLTLFRPFNNFDVFINLKYKKIYILICLIANLLPVLYGLYLQRGQKPKSGDHESFL